MKTTQSICTFENTNPGDRVETIDRTSPDADSGRVSAVRADGTCTVKWDSGVETPCDLSALRHANAKAIG